MSSRDTDATLILCSRFKMRSILLATFVILGVLQDHQVSCIWNCKDIAGNSTLQRLKEYLFCFYDGEVRPTEDYRNATVVQFGMSIRQFEVDEISNTVNFHVWSKLMWTDPHLTWEPWLFDGIRWLQVMSYDIWVPDIVLHSVTTSDIDMEMPRVECWLQYMGTVFCVPSEVHTVFCESDHTWWPYDTMNCTLYITSWSHSTNEIDIRFVKLVQEGQLTEDVYEASMEWDLVHISQSERLIESKFGVGFTSKMLLYHVILERYSSMYTAYYGPMMLALVMMTLMVLWLDPRSTERMVIANLNFVLHLLCLQDVQWKIPYNGATVPKLLVFYENSLVLAAFSLILTSILRQMQELSTEAPAWMSSVTVSILRSRVGQVFLVSMLDPKMSARMETSADDNTNLVSFNQKESTWKYVSILIGWLAFFLVFFVYVIMFALLLPTSSSKSFSSNA